MRSPSRRDSRSHSFFAVTNGKPSVSSHATSSTVARLPSLVAAFAHASVSLVCVGTICSRWPSAPFSKHLTLTLWSQSLDESKPDVAAACSAHATAPPDGTCKKNLPLISVQSMFGIRGTVVVVAAVVMLEVPVEVSVVVPVEVREVVPVEV